MATHWKYCARNFFTLNGNAAEAEALDAFFVQVKFAGPKIFGVYHKLVHGGPPLSGGFLVPEKRS